MKLSALLIASAYARPEGRIAYGTGLTKHRDRNVKIEYIK